jgi:hypothetical protein
MLSVAQAISVEWLNDSEYWIWKDVEESAHTGENFPLFVHPRNWQHCTGLHWPVPTLHDSYDTCDITTACVKYDSSLQ